MQTRRTEETSYWQSNGSLFLSPSILILSFLGSWRHSDRIAEFTVKPKWFGGSSQFFSLLWYLNSNVTQTSVPDVVYSRYSIHSSQAEKESIPPFLFISMGILIPFVYSCGSNPKKAGKMLPRDLCIWFWFFSFWGIPCFSALLFCLLLLFGIPIDIIHPLLHQASFFPSS